MAREKGMEVVVVVVVVVEVVKAVVEVNVEDPDKRTLGLFQRHRICQLSKWTAF